MAKKKEETVPPATFPELFAQFSKFNDPKSDGKTMPLSQSDKWMKQANLIGVTKLSTTDTGLCFSKFKRRALTFAEYKTFLQDIAKTKGMPYDFIINQMLDCGLPGVAPSAATATALKPLI